ncbi:MAG: L-threonylcarbamoyladenylate synthase [Acetivibrio sp.]
MKTKTIKINEKNCTTNEFYEAAQILRKGGLVAFPTETVYGLGGDGLKEDAAKKIYEAKGRPSDNPLIIHIADLGSLALLAEEVPETGKKLAEAFWPGPLTMIFPKKKEVPYGTTGGLDTVAVRMPSHKIALELIRISGVCIAAPSANTSGRPSPTRASHVKDDLDGKIDMIIDGGEVGIGIESTIVDLTGEVPTILRPGFITKKMLEDVVGRVEVDKAILGKSMDPNLKPKAPGMKYKHYAPKGDLTILEGNTKAVIKTINEKTEEALQSGKTVGIIASDETRSFYTKGIVKEIGTRTNEVSISQKLYGILREFDDLNVDIIYSESFASDNLGQAIMNRLLKAAGYQIVTCE